MVRVVAAAAESFAEMRAFSKLGTAIAAMIKMIATTINSSISEKPFCFFIMTLSLLVIKLHHGYLVLNKKGTWFFRPCPFRLIPSPRYLPLLKVTVQAKLRRLHR